MAHVRQEFALGAVGRFCGLLGSHKRCLSRSPLGDVASDTSQPKHVTSRVPERHFGRQEPDCVARHVLGPIFLVDHSVSRAHHFVLVVRIFGRYLLGIKVKVALS